MSLTHNLKKSEKLLECLPKHLGQVNQGYCHFGRSILKNFTSKELVPESLRTGTNGTKFGFSRLTFGLGIQSNNKICDNF